MNSNNDYDDMKKYIRLMKENYQPNKNHFFGGAKQRLIKEEEKELSDEELQIEKEKMEDAVSKPIEFDNIKIYSDNVEMSGTLIRESIKFTFSLDSIDGIYISAEMLQLSDPLLEIIQKLRSYYITWSEYWSQEIR